MNLHRPARFHLKFNRICLWTLLILGVWVFHAQWVSAVSLVDHKGRQIPWDRPYSRIISLYSAHTENLSWLGASDQVIGVSVNDSFPEEAFSKKTKFSYHDGIEKYLAARPDLILIRPMIDNGYPQLIRRLEAYGIMVASFQPSDIEQMYTYWRDLGKLTGRSQRAEKMVDHFKSSILLILSQTQKISPKKRVYFESIHKRMKTFTPGSMPLFAVQTAGGINVATDAEASRNTNVAIYSKEKILAKADLIDVFFSQKGLMNPVTKQDIMNEPGFQVIKAVKNDQIYLIDERIISRPVPGLLQGIQMIGNLLYPDIFAKIIIKKDDE